MQLLSQKEFQELTNRSTNADFDTLEKAAENMINPLTGMYYERNSIDEDTDTNRVNWFKKALALQIEYMDDIGATSTYEMAQKTLKVSQLMEQASQQVLVQRIQQLMVYTI